MFRGSIVAIVTPFTPENRVDFAALTRLIEWQIENGTSAIVPCGTTGESPTLSHEEHQAVVEHVIKTVRKRVPVIAGTGSNCTAEAIALSQHAQQAGADAVLLVNPYYNKPTQEGLRRHFSAVADAIAIPVMLYNIPGRSAVGLELETIVRLAEHRNIRAIKEATGSVEFASLIKLRTPLALLSGDDTLTLPIIAVGGAGVVSVAANVAPRQMADLAKLSLENRMDEARALHYTLLPVFKALFAETNPICVKTALGLMNRCLPGLRLPLCEMTPPHKDQLRQALQSAGLL